VFVLWDMPGDVAAHIVTTARSFELPRHGHRGLACGTCAFMRASSLCAAATGCGGQAWTGSRRHLASTAVYCHTLW